LKHCNSADPRQHNCGPVKPRFKASYGLFQELPRLWL
jgi:hypothetical protein